MPATNDPRRTARLVLFENHYANLGDELKWDADRFHRLCSALQLTEYELGAMVRMKIAEVGKSLSANRFSDSASLHLTLVERAVFPSTKPPVFPCLSTSPS